MDFSLNEEQKSFQASARQFIDSKGGLSLARRYTEGEEQVLDELWAGLGNLGYMGITVSENYGGLGMGPLTLVPILEEMGRALIPGPYAETVAFAVPLLEAYGTEEQKQTYLSEIAEGKRKITLALLEDSAELVPSAIQLQARKDGEDYVLKGKKTLVPYAENADTFIVPVRTGGNQGEYGISLFLVDRENTNLTFNSLLNMDETRKLSNASFEGVRISKKQLIGSENIGWGILQEGLVHLNAALCSTMVGGMEKVVEMSTEYGKTRIQFGQPIGRFQAVKHRIVNMKMDQESSRSLTYYAAWAVENQSEDMIEAVSLAKSFASEAYIRMASDNIQNHGGMGFTWEFDCHLFLKRARALENHLGSPEYHRELAAVELGW
ncbi:acyl-CoA dehydrogenase [Pueribacillus theae]|uniref:Acyl-CoA dehydrogenase n=1 Tax=Pueribacillus theae TaxID=2171751 RepID=A0A2U1JSS5_9BACI|nr:acyl-CoA dehydrogenase family protein [Pueribacillus theae]PWA07933.1 acyl-CoA dehydrogenase [Pueribacillus theae]